MRVMPTRTGSPNTSTDVDLSGTDSSPRPSRVATILVAEDDILTRMAASSHLRDGGHRVLEASDGEEARTLLRASEPIDVVFSDINMPGMDGIELAHWIAREFPDIIVILASGDLRNAAAAKVAAHFLEKPYDLRTLGRLIDGLL